MAEYQTYTDPARARLVSLYRSGLRRLDTKLAKLYESGVPLKGDILRELKDEVKTLAAQRKVIIQEQLKRTGKVVYKDTLHTAARMVGVDIQLGEISDADVSALLRRRPRSVPSFQKLLKKHEKDSLSITPKRVSSLLPDDLTDQTKVRSAIKQGLTVDANITIRFTNAEATRLVNNATNLAFDVIQDPQSTINKLIQAAGVTLVKVWMHDSPMVPREYHRDVLDGSLPDRNGYWYQDGDKADGPGGFSDPKNNINCKCSIEVMTVDEYLATYGRSRLQPWSYLPEVS